MLWKRENGTFGTAWCVLFVPTGLEGVMSTSLEPGLRLETGSSSAEKIKRRRVISKLLSFCDYEV